MMCNGKSCVLEEDPVEKYNWWSTNYVENYTCEFVTRIIDARTKNTHVFTEKCRPTHTYCILQDSTVVWQSDVIHTCPLNLVHKGTFTFSNPDMLVDQKNHMALQIDRIVTMCEENFIVTGDNLYVTKNKYIQTLKICKRTTVRLLPILNSKFSKVNLMFYWGRLYSH